MREKSKGPTMGGKTSGPTIGGTTTTTGPIIKDNELKVNVKDNSLFVNTGDINAQSGQNAIVGNDNKIKTGAGLVNNGGTAKDNTVFSNSGNGEFNGNIGKIVVKADVNTAMDGIAALKTGETTSANGVGNGSKKVEPKVEQKKANNNGPSINGVMGGTTITGPIINDNELKVNIKDNSLFANTGTSFAVGGQTAIEGNNNKVKTGPGLVNNGGTAKDNTVFSNTGNGAGNLNLGGIIVKADITTGTDSHAHGNGKK